MRWSGRAIQNYIPLHSGPVQTGAGEAIVDFCNTRIAVLGSKYGSSVFVFFKKTYYLDHIHSHFKDYILINLCT